MAGATLSSTVHLFDVDHNLVVCVNETTPSISLPDELFSIFQLKVILPQQLGHGQPDALLSHVSPDTGSTTNEERTISRTVIIHKFGILCLFHPSLRSERRRVDEVLR